MATTSQYIIISDYWKFGEREREKKTYTCTKQWKQKMPHGVGTVPKSNNKNRKRKQNYCDIWTKTTGFIYEWFLIEDSQLCCNLMWPSIVIISEEKFEDTKEEIRSCQMKDNELAKRKWQKDKQWSTKRCKHKLTIEKHKTNKNR